MALDSEDNNYFDIKESTEKDVNIYARMEKSMGKIRANIRK